MPPETWHDQRRDVLSSWSSVQDDRNWQKFCSILSHRIKKRRIMPSIKIYKTSEDYRIHHVKLKDWTAQVMLAVLFPKKTETLLNVYEKKMDLLRYNKKIVLMRTAGRANITKEQSGSLNNGLNYWNYGIMSSGKVHLIRQGKAGCLGLVLLKRWRGGGKQKDLWI